jgi:hypothetical protein
MTKIWICEPILSIIISISMQLTNYASLLSFPFTFRAFRFFVHSVEWTLLFLQFKLFHKLMFFNQQINVFYFLTSFIRAQLANLMNNVEQIAHPTKGMLKNTLWISSSNPSRHNFFLLWYIREWWFRVNLGLKSLLQIIFSLLF